MAPPCVLMWPFAIVRLLIAAPVVPEFTVRTEKLLDEPPPETVTKFWSVAPLPVVSP